jgi:hypothetical protein
MFVKIPDKVLLNLLLCPVEEAQLKRWQKVFEQHYFHNYYWR